ncbi:unnamed protein product [Plutella xylostella]|uniref:(diamondback moth) hypothetical protein n=1 Tax=Plutella xylostella TaxID=51655 RepID=A0A8S4GB79_PLUXY|nr:unnamed protein product [Plutella xylostella]
MLSNLSDYDPAVVEQKEASQPSCIPLSYILRFFTENTRREFQSMPPSPRAGAAARLMSARKLLPFGVALPQAQATIHSGLINRILAWAVLYSGSELDDEEMMTQSEDSNDSWTTVEEYSSEYILRYGVKQHSAQMAQAPLGAPQDKPFACPVPGCKKRYKNVNGIKYHSKNGHKKDGSEIKKAYKCHCGKSYKTAQGLKNHSVHHGASALLEAKPKQPGLVVTAAHRPISILDAVDNKLVRIYDSLKTKDLPSLTIPKHNLKTVDYTWPVHSERRYFDSELDPGVQPRRQDQVWRQVSQGDGAEPASCSARALCRPGVHTQDVRDFCKRSRDKRLANEFKSC